MSFICVGKTCTILTSYCNLVIEGKNNARHTIMNSPLEESKMSFCPLKINSGFGLFPLKESTKL